jgi:uncharacterized protein with PIN domain
LLAAADPNDAERVPISSRHVATPLRKCRTCGRIYWPGGHVRRMQRRLILWQGHCIGAEECTSRDNIECERRHDPN